MTKGASVMSKLREELEERRARGSKQIQVAAALALLNEDVPASPPDLDELLYEDEPKRDGLTVGGFGLMGTWEVSRYLGVEKSRIARWLDELDKGKHPIAPPVARLKSGSLWLGRDVYDKLVAMYADARFPYGKSEAGMERWADERRLGRARRDQRAAA